jgi:chorismate mutase/prephenate dehydratase
MATISDVFREVESEAASYGVVPIENSTEGVINHTLDEFMTSSLKICGEVALRIHHHLLGQGDDLTKIRKIYSHQQSLAQCRHWLDSHAPEIELVDVSSNAEAARRVAAEPAAAAIAGEAAAEIYGLNVISRNIEDEPDNTTRFLVIGRRETPASGTDKTSLLVYTDNRPGALYAILEPFARNGISMTRIESRPSRLGMWNYVFFIDIEGHVTDTDVVTALQELAQSASRVTVLGSYPRAVL